jgi:hypothetical protein
VTARLTRHQARALAVISVRAATRFRRAKHLSDAGNSIEDAAQSLGMTVGGVKSMLAREVGSSCWPIREKRHG